MNSLKKTEVKRLFPSSLPYREIKGKETTPSFLGKLVAPRASVARRRKREFYALARAVAEEIIDSCFGSRNNDLRLWASIVYEYPEKAEDILEKAREYRSMWRQREIRNPITAFQRWLGKNFPKKVWPKSRR